MQNLHTLSDIGISLLDAISNRGVSHSHISGLILLPSSLYKVGQEHNSQASSFHLIGICFVFLIFIYTSSFLLQGKSDLLIRYQLDENFIRSLLDISKKKVQVYAFTPALIFISFHGSA